MHQVSSARAAWVALLALSGVALDAVAQVPSRPMACPSDDPTPPVLALTTTTPNDPTAYLRALRDTYLDGDESETQKRVRELLELVVAECRVPGTAGCCLPPGFDPQRTPASVVFLAPTQTGERQLIRIFVNGADVYRARYSGVEALSQFFLADTLGQQHSSSFSSTPLEDPVEKSIAEFVKLFSFETFPVTLAPNPPVPAADDAALLLHTSRVSDAPPPPLRVTMSEVALPEKRATVKINDRIKRSVPITTASAAVLMKRAQSHTERVKAREGISVRCASDLAEATQIAVNEKLKAGAPWKEIREAIRGVTADVFEACDAVVSIDAEQLEVLKEIEEGYLTIFTAPKAAELKGEFTARNVPKQRFGLSVLAGVVATADDDDRASISEGVVQVSPLGSVHAGLAFQWHPVAFDPEESTMSSAQRFRFILGASYQPEFGLFAGVGWEVVQHLSINAGYGGFLTDTRRDVDAFGEAPVNPNNPLNQRFIGHTFISLGYSFGGT